MLPSGSCDVEMGYVLVCRLLRYSPSSTVWGLPYAGIKMIGVRSADRRLRSVAPCFAFLRSGARGSREAGPWWSSPTTSSSW